MMELVTMVRRRVKRMKGRGNSFREDLVCSFGVLRTM